MFAGGILEIAIRRRARSRNSFTSGRSFSALFRIPKCCGDGDCRAFGQKDLQWTSKRRLPWSLPCRLCLKSVAMQRSSGQLTDRQDSGNLLI